MPKPQAISCKEKKKAKLKSLQGKSGLEHVWPRATPRAFITELSGEGLGVLGLQQQGALPATAPGLGPPKSEHRGTEVPLLPQARGSWVSAEAVFLHVRRFLGGMERGSRRSGRCTGLGALPVLVVPAIVHRGWRRGLLGDLGPALPATTPGLPTVAVVADPIVGRGRRARAPHIPAVRAPLVGRGVRACPAVATWGPVGPGRVGAPEGLPEALVEGVLGVVPTTVLVARALRGSGTDRAL